MADGTYFVRGKGYWMKVLGPPQLNYDKDGREWTFEFKPNEEGQELFNELGVGDRVNKGENKDRILFRQREKRADGTLNRALTVVDAMNKPWNQGTLIGNDSDIEVKFRYVDNGKGRKASLYPQGIRVLQLVPYEREEFAPLAEDDEFFRKPVEDDFHKDFGLDNDDDEVV